MNEKRWRSGWDDKTQNQILALSEVGENVKLKALVWLPDIFAAGF